MPADSSIPLIDLQRVTTPFLKFADVLADRRTLVIAERRAVRWLLVAFEHAAGKLDATSLGVHGQLLEKLRRVLATPAVEPLAVSDFSLDDLKDMTVPFLRFADALGRPLTQNERRAFRWLLNAFELTAIKADFLAMSEDVLPFYSHLIEQLRQVLTPDPVRQLRLHREKPEKVGELCPGNFALRNAPFSGVSVRSLTHTELAQFITLLGKLADGMAVSARVLALARQADRDEARQIGGAAKRMIAMARAFAARCSPLRIPAQPSIEETMEQCRLMSELMGKAAPVEDRNRGEGEEAA